MQEFTHKNRAAHSEFALDKRRTSVRKTKIPTTYRSVSEIVQKCSRDSVGSTFCVYRNSLTVAHDVV